MKTKPINELANQESREGASVIPLQRAKEIMEEEGIEYTNEELKEVMNFLAKVVSITTAHFERKKQGEAKVISINTKTTHETKSVPLHPGEYRRAS